MKKTYLLITLLFFTVLNINAQKPKKTFNHEVFAKKFTKFTRGTIVALFGYDNEMKYISSKTGESVADLNKAKAAASTRINEEISLTKKQALLMVYDKVELTITQESPIKKADMKIFVHSGATKYTFTLKNCTQTNRTWVLGNDALAEGDMFEAKKSSDNEVIVEVIVEELVEEVVEEKTENFNITPFGMNLISSLKKTSPDVFIIYNMSTRDLIESFEHYTKDEDMKNGMIERMKKKESTWEAEITKYFNNIKKDSRITNWNDIKFVSAKFEKQSISDEFNFVWGKAVITFSYNGENFELLANEMAQLYSGWRANNIILR